MTRADRPPPMFLAEALGLDVLNTVATPSGSRIEWLGNGRDLLDWLEVAALIPAEISQRMRTDVEPGRLDAVASEARALREWFRAFVNAHKGLPVGADALRDLARLNHLLGREDAYGSVVARPPGPDDGGGYDGGVARGALQWHWQRRWRTPDDLLLPIARAMAEVVCETDFRLVKACEGPACTMLFLDTTKGHARRWCSMAVCGNRAKQAAYRARTRGSPDV